MVNINYMKSVSGLDNCFEFLFPVKDYIDEKFFSLNKNNYAVELSFYISLFLKHGLFDGNRNHCHQSIWSYRYDCFFRDIPFSMIFDEDYDIVSFSVDEININYRKEIAEYVKQLIELKPSLEIIEIEDYMW